MKLQNPLLVVRDMDRSTAFYRQVLGLEIMQDFGVNKTLTGGLCLQTAESWTELTGCQTIVYGADNGEIYFEEDDFDSFLIRLEHCRVDYVHPVKEHAWGQRVVRFYDPDRHMIEVGENIQVVCRRFLDSGLTPEQTAKRMDVPLDFVNSCLM